MAGKTLTTGEIAKYCGVNFRTVIRWIKRGHLKAYQLPGRGDNRVELEDFFEFLRAYRMPIPEELKTQEGKGKVLVVDDDASMARTIQRVLRRAGFDTMIVSDGFQAGILIEDFSPALITLDLKMPGLGGLDVLKFVKSNEKLSNMKILVISALPQPDLDEALKAGADDVLEKPFDNKILLDKVSRLTGVELPA